MTVENTACSITYDGNDADTDFPTTFRFLAAAHLVVETSDDDGETWTTLTLDDDYEVAGANAAEPGGTVTTADPVATGTKLRITRSTPVTQLNSFQTTGSLPVATIETSFDKLTMIAQEQAAAIAELQGLGDLVDVGELADAIEVGEEINVDADSVDESFPLEIVCAGGQAAKYVVWQVERDGATDVPFAEPPHVQWVAGPTNKLTVQRISGLEPGVTYFLTGLVFF